MTFWDLMREAGKYNLEEVARQYLKRDYDPVTVWEILVEEYNL